MFLRASIVAPLLLIAAGALASDRGSDWQIGPEIRGKNYSTGMPPVMAGSQDGPTFLFPTAREGHVNYVTMRTGSLADARSLTIKYRIDAAPGTRFFASERPEKTAVLSLYFQRRGDDWSARGKYATYRWYSISEKTLLLVPGEHTITINFDDEWIGVMGAPSRGNPAYQRALESAGNVGFVMGWQGGRGHGVYASGPARFTLLDFEIS